MRRSIDDHNLLLSIENAPEIAAKAGHGDPTPEEMEAVHRKAAAIREKAKKNLEITLAAIDRRNPGTPPTKLPGVLLALAVAGVLAFAVGVTTEPRNEDRALPPVPHQTSNEDPWRGAGPTLVG